MNSFKVFFTLVFAVFYTKILAPVDAQEYPELAKFLKKYQCSSSVEAQSGGITDRKAKDTDSARTYYNKPLDYDMSQFMRIINARRLSNYLKESKFDDNFAVPQKCVSKNLSHIIATGIRNNNTSTVISLQQMQQLVKIIKEAGYLDFRGINLLSGDDGKLYFIDTEDTSFWFNAMFPEYGAITPEKIRQGLSELLVYVNNENIRSQKSGVTATPEAILYLEQEYEKAYQQARKEKRENACWNKMVSMNYWFPKYPLPVKSKYDDSGFNFERVKREYQRFYEQRILANRVIHAAVSKMKNTEFLGLSDCD